MLDVEEIIKRNLEQCRQEISRAIESTGRKASGRTQESMHVFFDRDTGTLYGRRAFYTLERGRRPGKTPRNFVDIIRQWIIDKQIRYKAIPYKMKASDRWKPKYTPQERGLRAASGAIAHKIASEGTSLYRKGGSEDVYTPAVTKAVANIRSEIAGIYKEEILKDLRTLKKG